MDSVVKHTAGPWFWALDSHNRPTNLMRSGTGDYVLSPQSDLRDYGLSSDEWCDLTDGDAALIAAAPDLLEALRDVIRMRDDFDRGDRNQAAAYYAFVKAEDSTWAAVRAAIAKAEGQPALSNSEAR